MPLPPPSVPVVAPMPAPATPQKRSTLMVYAPAGARVDVDGQALVSRGAPLKIDVAGGEHHVVVTQARRQPFDERVRVAPGATAEVRVKLARLQKGAPKGADTVVTPSPGSPREPEAKPPEKKTGDYTLDPF
jgi:hypothetical protein